MPSLSTGQAFAIQEEGYQQFGDDFHFIVPELKLFGFSPRASRERLPNGDVAFTPRPWFPKDLVVFSGTRRSHLHRPPTWH